MSTELPRRQRATGTRAKICIVASEYNEQYTQALVENCSEELKTVLPSVRLEIIRVPGAFEIPVAIKSVLSRSPEKRPDAVVALGVILRGSTDHAARPDDGDSLMEDAEQGVEKAVRGAEDLMDDAMRGGRTRDRNGDLTDLENGVARNSTR